MTIRKLNSRYEVKLPLVPDGLLVLACDSLAQAQQLDKIGRLNERVVNQEACSLDEVNIALQTLAAAGMEESVLFERIAALAAQLGAKE